jgi:hypothetical protein
MAANAQVDWCNQTGTPLGPGVICVAPWTPVENESFSLNFASTSCTQQTNHEYQVIRNGQNFNIYMVYGVGGCPGVPQGPLTFSTNQGGVPAGTYTAHLYRFTVPNWPPPPFNPDDYTLHNSVNFTVLGEQPPAIESVPVLGKVALFAFAALLLAIAANAFRTRRSL